MVIAADPPRPPARSSGRRARPPRSGRARPATAPHGARRVARAWPSAVWRSPTPRSACRAASSAASTCSALRRAVSDIRGRLRLGPLHRADVQPARRGSQAFEGSACTRRARLGGVQLPHGHGQLLGRRPLLQLAHPEHRVEAEAVGLHGAISSVGTKVEQRLGRRRQRAGLADRLAKERVDGGTELDRPVHQGIGAGNVGVDLNRGRGRRATPPGARAPAPRARSTSGGRDGRSHPRDGLEHVDGRIVAALGQRPGEPDMSVEDRPGRVGDGLVDVVALDQDGVEAGDRTRARLGRHARGAGAAGRRRSGDSRGWPVAPPPRAPPPAGPWRTG